ncbi:MAG: thioredoxin family protein [Polyangia bacterium]
MRSSDAGASDPIPTLTSDTFEGLVLLASGPVAVQFMADGCARCRELEPVLLRAASILESRVRLYRLNVPMEKTIADAYGIKGTPTFVKFLDGREIGRLEVPLPELEGLVANLTRGFDT